MGLSSTMGRNGFRIWKGTAVFLLVMLVTSAMPALATVYQYSYGSVTGSIRAPSVSLSAGTAGTSSISPVASDAATVSVIAGLTFYENAAPDTSCTAPAINTILSALGAAGGPTRFNRGSSVCLWSTQFTSAQSLYAGTWVTDLWLSAQAAGYGLTVTMSVTNSGGTPTATVFTGTTSNVPTSETEARDTYAGSAVSIPANGYLMLMLTAPTGGGKPRNWNIYWGAGQLTSFQTTADYNYVLALTNPTASSWTVNLGLASSSGLARLSNMTVKLTEPSASPYTLYSQQLTVSAGSVTKSLGPAVSLAASTTMYVYVYALATSINTSSFVISVTVQSGTTTAYTMYTVNLAVN
jgi:hypothetical protein